MQEVFVCFYHGISTIVQHGLIDDFLRIMYPVTYDHDSRPAYVDASSFHNCIHFCQEEWNKRRKLATT